MKRLPLRTSLILTIAFQLIILVGMLVQAAIPLWIGSEIQVKVKPIDPRSPLRGNYVRLNYDIGTLPKNSLKSPENLRLGEVVYVRLKQGSEGLYEFARASLKLPEEGIFLRGRIANYSPPYRIKYGIEAFFVPKEKALELEVDLLKGGVAVLMVTSSGRAALKNIISNHSFK